MHYLIIATIFAISSVESLLITVEQGTLNGTHLEARNGKLFNAFYGIPYAKPPIGKLRFKPPVKAGPWKGILDATQHPPICIQTLEGTSTIEGTEDCLYLDIYTPLNARKGSNLPVIVYIFGGKFKQGSTYENGPQNIMQNDVIIVFPSYRLGVFGFLSTGDTVIPGNFGLKDQTLAMKWVQKNIHHFGGDPDRVTLHGHSSGAACVHLHTLSPASKGLFHKVIIQSGVGSCTIEYFGPDVSRAIAKEFGIRVGCPSVTSSQDMYECFMNIPPNITASIPEQMYVWDLDPDATFRPTIEDKNAEQAFLTEMPNQARYQANNIPWLIGITTGEGAFKVARYLNIDNDAELAPLINEDYELLFPITMQYLWNTKVEDLNFISKALRKRYFGNREIGKETDREMTSMYTDAMYGFCTIDAIRTYPGPKHVYLYNYSGNYSMKVQNCIGNYDKFLGPSHADEVRLFFERQGTIDLINDEDLRFGDELIKRWINFAYTSDPNSPMKIDETIMGYWKPVTSNRIEYLFIDWNGTMRTDLYKGTYQFWKSLPIGSRYYNYGKS
ncbi:esterase E4-like [Planococcus citri]|uniref:esterase E4-like n=1 Tax=Planococcus citri TaxID=170843 RepID=UPI0031F8F21E